MGGVSFGPIIDPDEQPPLSNRAKDVTAIISVCLIIFAVFVFFT